MTDVENSTRNGRLRPRRKTQTNIKPTRSLRKSVSKIGEDTVQESSTTSAQLSLALSSSDDIPPNEKAVPPGQLFLCLYCERTFPSKKSVSKHVQRIHNASARRDSLKCCFCNHVETDITNFINHMLESHPSQYFACVSCVQRFSSSQELNEHFLNKCNGQRLQQQEQPYRSKLRHRVNSTTANQKVEPSKQFDVAGNEPLLPSDLNDVVVSCELNIKKDDIDFEESISMNLILPQCKSLCNDNLHEKRAVIVLDDIHWKRKPSNIAALQRGDRTDQILSRLGVVHRSRGTETSRYWYRHIDDSTKFERCFDTTFYLKVANNVQENLLKFLDGACNAFHKEGEPIKTRKSKNNVLINTIEGFPTLLALGQFSRNTIDDLPRAIAPKQKWKWDNTENDKQTATIDDMGIIKNDSHKSKCIISLFSSLDIWTQLRMRQKYEKTFTGTKKIEKSNTSNKELQQIIESRELPHTSTQIKYTSRQSCSTQRLDFPLSLGLVPSASEYVIEPAVLSGEWARKRCYVCCACGEQSQDPKSLTAHYTTHHPQAQVNHYEIVGDELLNADILKHLYVPPATPVRMQRRYRGSKTCTKCNRHLLGEHLHGHILECAGDTPVPRRKVRYRPFGVRRRRTRLPEKAIRKQLRKNMRSRRTRAKKLMRSRPRMRSDVGDAETIKKMIADLPAKRHRVSAAQMNNNPRQSRCDEMRREKQIQMRLKRRLSEKDTKRSRLKTPETEKVERKVTRSKLTTKDINLKEEKTKGKISQKLCSKGKVLKVKITRKTVARRSERKSHGNPKTTSPGNKEETPASSSSTEASTAEGALNLSSKLLDQSDTNIANSARSASTGSGTSNSRKNIPNEEPGRSNSQNPNSPKNQIPLKHSIASLTATSHVNTNNRKHPYVPMQENVSLETSFNNYHPFDDHRLLIQEEGHTRKLDKPPISTRSDDYSATSKSKANKPRRGLNDCIAMLKGKLGESPTRIPYENTQPDLNPARDNSLYTNPPIHSDHSPMLSQHETMMTSYNPNVYAPPLQAIDYSSAPMVPLDLSGKSSCPSVEPGAIAGPSRPVVTPPLCLAPIQSEPLPLVTTPGKSVKKSAATPPIRLTAPAPIAATSRLATSPLPVLHPVQPRGSYTIPPPLIPPAVDPISRECWKHPVAVQLINAAPPTTVTSVPAPIIKASSTVLNHVSTPSVHTVPTLSVRALTTSSGHQSSPASATLAITPPSSCQSMQSITPPSSHQPMQSLTRTSPGLSTVATLVSASSTLENSSQFPTIQVSTPPPTSIAQTGQTGAPTTAAVAIIQTTRALAVTPSMSATTSSKRFSDTRRSAEKTSPKGNQIRSTEKAAGQRPVFDPTLKIPQYKVRQNSLDCDPKEGPLKSPSEVNTPDLTESAVALLPKEIVEILGTMSAHNRNTLLNALPQVLAKTVKDLKLVVDSNVSVESLTSPNKSEIATQTTNATLEQECPQEFLNLDTDKFLIDPVTGAIKERPQKEVLFPGIPESHNVIHEPVRLDVIDLTAEEEETEKKVGEAERNFLPSLNASRLPEPESLLSVSISVPTPVAVSIPASLSAALPPPPVSSPLPPPPPPPMSAPIQEAVPTQGPVSIQLPGTVISSNIQSLVQISASPLKSKGSNGKTASLRAVRIKSANGKQKILNSKDTNALIISTPPALTEIVISPVALEPNPSTATALTLETAESEFHPELMVSPSIQKAEISSTQHNQTNVSLQTLNLSPVDNNATSLTQETILNDKTEEINNHNYITKAADLTTSLPQEFIKISNTETLNKGKTDNKMIKCAPSTDSSVPVLDLFTSVQSSNDVIQLTEKVCLQPLENLQERKEIEELQFSEKKPEIPNKVGVQKIEKNENKPPTCTNDTLNIENKMSNLADEDDPEDDVSLAVIVKQKLLKDTKKKSSRKRSKKWSNNDTASIHTDKATISEHLLDLSESQIVPNNLQTPVKAENSRTDSIVTDSTSELGKGEITAKRGKKITNKFQSRDQAKKDTMPDITEDISEDGTSTPSSLLPLRRSRRIKSVFSESTTFLVNAPHEDNFPAAAVIENKLPLTKKQLIFSKLLDEKKTQDLKLKDLTNPKSVNVIDVNMFHGELVLGCENAKKSEDVPLITKMYENEIPTVVNVSPDSGVQESKKRKKDVPKKNSQNVTLMKQMAIENEIEGEVNEKQAFISESTLLEIPGFNKPKKGNEMQSTINGDSKPHNVDIERAFKDVIRISDHQVQDEKGQILLDDTKKKLKNRKAKKRSKVTETLIPPETNALESPVTSSTDVDEIVQKVLITDNDITIRDIDVTEKENKSNSNEIPKKIALSEQTISASTEDIFTTESNSTSDDIVPSKKIKKSSTRPSDSKNMKTNATESENNAMYNNKEETSISHIANKFGADELIQTVLNLETLPAQVPIGTDLSLPNETPKRKKSYLKRKFDAVPAEKESGKKDISFEINEPQSEIEKSTPVSAHVIDTYEFTEDDFNTNSFETQNLECVMSKKRKKLSLKRKNSPSNYKKQKSKKSEILDRPFYHTEEVRSKVSMPKTQLEADLFSNTHIPEQTPSKEDSVDVSNEYLFSGDLTSDLSYATRRTRSKSVLFKTVTATSPQDFDILLPVCDSIEFTNSHLTAKDKDNDAIPTLQKEDAEKDFQFLPKLAKTSKKNNKKSMIKKDKTKKQKCGSDKMDMAVSSELELTEANLPEKLTDQFNVDTKCEQVPVHATKPKNVETFSDSDDSSKSDVPLNKYVKEVSKKKAETHTPESIKRDKGKGGPSAFIKNRRKTVAVISTSPPRDPETVEEQTKSDQFMESFGFFSERKPRKSNLLAAKKIFETFHVSGNDSDDVSYREHERIPRRHPQRECNRPSRNVVTVPSPAPEPKAKEEPQPNKRKAIREDIKKKATRNAYCTICRKHFRRPDNLVRHQLTLLHVSNLSALEQNLMPNIQDEPPNCLVVYGRHLDKLRMMQKREGGEKRGHLPTLSEILQMMPPANHSCDLSERNLSGDEALFYECCELLKESHTHKVVESQPNIDSEQVHQSTVTYATEIVQPLVSTSFTLTTTPSMHTDDDINPLTTTANEILESEHLLTLESELKAGSKKSSAMNTFNEETLSPITDTTPSAGPYDFTSDDETKMAEMRISRYKSEKARNNSMSSSKEKAKSNGSTDRGQENEREVALRREMERLQSLPSTSTGIYHATDLFEDKFDKIKRKCRSQAAAARNVQLSLDSSSSGKSTKKTEKKSSQKKNSKKLQCSVPTKGALKGFDGIKVSIPTSDIKLPVAVPSLSDETVKKKKKKTRSRKPFNSDMDLGPPVMQKTSSIIMTPKNKVDVYEFMDDTEDNDSIEFRPTSLSDRIKSALKTQSASQGITLSSDTREEDAEESEESTSDGDDFVYMSDDYLCSANETETENSLMSCELGNGGKLQNDSKKLSSKRKESVEKSTVMGKIFKNNAVRNERRDCSRESASVEKTNLDQLFDSLLEKEPDSFAEKEECHSTEEVADQREPTPTPREPTLTPRERTPSPSELDPDPEPDPAEDLQTSDKEGGVARQRARRKCTVGKQNILTETWSSESEQETSYARRPHAAESAASLARKKRCKRSVAVNKPRHAPAREEEAREAPSPGGDSNGERRVLHYYNSEEEETRLVEQHGWIVGDSHKKLVTMLAHAKGRKRDDKRNFLE